MKPCRAGKEEPKLDISPNQSLYLIPGGSQSVLWGDVLVWHRERRQAMKKGVWSSVGPAVVKET